MAGELGHLAALFVQPHPAAALLHIEVFNLHSGGRSDAGEGVPHKSDQGSVAEPEQGSGVDRGQKFPHLVGREDGSLAFADAVLRAPYRMGRVGLHDVPGHQPIEEHPNRGQVLFDGRLRVRAAELLDVGRDVHRCHPGQISQTSTCAPGGKALDGFQIGAAGIGIANVDSEELPEAPATFGHALEEHGQVANAGLNARNDDLVHALCSSARIRSLDRRTTRWPFLATLPAADQAGAPGPS